MCKEDGKHRRIKLSEIAKHCTADDFWTAIDGMVYDMSNYSATHPGGSIIMLVAGTDSTVMFNQYHIHDHAKAERYLWGRRIGVLEGSSPKMGSFYLELRSRVAEALRSEPKRPLRSRILFFVDLLLACCILVWSLCASTTSPLWQLFLLSHTVPTVVLRLFGQSHAPGHMQLFQGSLARSGARILMAIGAPGMQMFVLPGPLENPRKLLNESHTMAQSEYPQNRGPCEHQSVHHVMGAEFDEDECCKVASVFHLTRLAAHQRHLPFHRLQKYRAYQIACDAIVETSLAVAVGAVERIVFIASYLVPQRLWIDVACSCCGFLVGCAIARAHLLLPAAGVQGVCLFAFGSFLKRVLLVSHAQIYFAQHVWDNEVDLATINEDWGKHNAETSFSLRGIQRHPALWGMKGASAATLTYHLEHSLLPGLNYLHLPKIAPIVQATCKEFGIDYHMVDGPEDLRLQYQEYMTKYAAFKHD